MLLKVKKEIEETVELKTPAYYKDYIGNPVYINKSGEVITVRNRMISIWTPEDGAHYTEEIEKVLQQGTPCSKDEFDKAYVETMDKLNVAVGMALINS
jgi:hypothetical protein